jgi:hypothetical protein
MDILVQNYITLQLEYALDLGLREKDQPLSLQWYRNFITRWPNLAVKKPRTLAIVHAKAVSEENVTAYFKQLDKILTKYNLKEKPQHMYNIDEKGISENYNPPKVVGDKHVTPVSVTSGMSGTVTVLGSGNALDTAIPPYFVFMGKRMRSELLEGATPGASGTVSETGWSNSTVFRKYLEEHFMKYIQGRDPLEPLILLYDGHTSHVSLGIIDWAMELNLILFVLPPHTSHILQPLDVGCVGPLQNIYDNLKAKVMRENSSSSIPNHSVCNTGCKAYMLSLNPTNLCSSFRKCGIYPVDAIHFLPSTVFKSKKTQASDTEVEPTPISDTEPVNSPEPVETVPTSRQDREQDTTVEFFRSKEDVLLDKSRETTIRKVLSAIVGGKAITEDHVIKEIQTH